MKQPGVVRECEHPGKPHKHGYECYWMDKCRCPAGRAAAAAKAREARKVRLLGLHQPRYIDSTGTRRRIEALTCLGYDIQWQCEQAGLSRKFGENIIANRQQAVRRETAQAFRDLYDKWWNVQRVGHDHPTRITVSMTVNRARARGYVPPMGWDDDAIDDPDAQPSDPQYLDYPSRCRLARELLSIGVDVQSTSRSAMVSYKTAQKIKREEAA